MAAICATVATVAGGCGGGEGFAPAAEPASSPPLERRPAGELLPIGAEGEGIAVDSRTRIAAVIARDPSSLVLIDLRTWSVEGRVRLPAAGRHLEPAPAGGEILVPVEGDDSLFTVSVPDGATTRVGVGDFPHDVAVAGGRAFVGDEMGDTLSVIDDDRVTAMLEAPVQPGGVAAGGGFVAVVAVAERVLQVYDPETLERLGSVDAGVGPTHLVADGNRAYVADTDGDEILVIRLAPEPQLLFTAPAPGTPYGIAVDGRRNRLWVTLTARNRLLELAIGEGGLRRIASHPTVRQPNTVAVDPRTGTALVAGRTARGPVQRVRPTRGSGG
jgi:DNA-binding beta-propeller fold protein YncE